MAPSAVADTVDNWVDSISDWLKSPLKPQGSALNWVLFVGLIIAILFFWQVILIDLTKE